MPSGLLTALGLPAVFAVLAFFAGRFLRGGRDKTADKMMKEDLDEAAAELDAIRNRAAPGSDAERAERARAAVARVRNARRRKSS